MRIRDKKVPCFTCKDRNIDCHSGCAEYMAYFLKKRENDDKKIKDTDFFEYKKKVIEKAVRRKRNSEIGK